MIHGEPLSVEYNSFSNPQRVLRLLRLVECHDIGVNRPVGM